jgi:hypothetical protein
MRRSCGVRCTWRLVLACELAGVDQIGLGGCLVVVAGWLARVVQCRAALEGGSVACWLKVPVRHLEESDKSRGLRHSCLK